MATTAALSPVPPPVRLEQERKRKKPKKRKKQKKLTDPAEILKKSKDCSAAGKRYRTQATVTALGLYTDTAGSPQQVAEAVAAFQVKPTWKAAVLALKRQGLPSTAMASQLGEVLQVKPGSLRQVISGVKNGKIGAGAADLVLVVQLYIIKKYHEKCGRLFR